MNQRHYEIARRMNEHTAAEARRLGLTDADLCGSGTRERLLEAANILPSLLMSVEGWWGEAFAGISERIDLSGADLSDGLFTGGRVLPGADLRNANLDNTRWWFVHTERADFSGASIRAAVSFNWCCEGARFHQTDFSGSTLSFYSTGEPIDLSGARLSGATIRLDSAIKYVLTSADMSGCRVKCGGVNAGTHQAYDQFMAALSDEQRRQIHLEITPAQIAESRAAFERLKQPEKKSGGCFIATACYGSADSADVIRLQRFRDERLRPTRAGRAVVRMYERSSPPIARWIERHPAARTIVRALLVRPVVKLVR